MPADTPFRHAARRLSFALLCAASLAQAQPTGSTESTKDQSHPPHPARNKIIDPRVANEVGRLPIRLDCKRQAPTEFPDQYDGIVVTNRGPYAIAAGRQVRWDIGGPQPQGGAFTLAEALPMGKAVAPAAVLTRADGDKACTARLLP
jgi:hypothetical protein